MNGGIVLLALDIVLLVAWVVVPFFRRGDEDKGDGLGVVKISPPTKVKARRTIFFYFVVVVAAVLTVAVRARVAHVYSSLVADLATGITHRPDYKRSWSESVIALVPILAAEDVILFACVITAPIGRRLTVAFNAVAIPLLCGTIDAVLLLAWNASGAQIGPRTVVGVIVNILVGTFVMVRVIFSSFELPRPTAVPLLRQRWSSDGLVAFFVLCGSIGFALATLAVVHAFASPGWVSLADHVAYPCVWLAIFLGLFLVGSSGGLPKLISDRPPIEVIIPAYNETAGIHLTLRSIDRAAARYGGPVRVVLADDGSTDGTGDLARAEMANFKAATGIVVPGPHLGKAMALNTAMSYCEASILVRIDADIIIHEDAFIPLPCWFKDPAVGSVGSMAYPRQDGHSWFHKMRMFECLVAYGFTRQALARVDAVICIPGTYTAFRREPAQAMGGFVSGMNGEDSDLTYQLARLGYKIAIDPRIVIYEDVPPTLPEFREQRIRWNRAGTQCYARHSPFTSGMAGPRIWLTSTRVLTMRLTSIARPCVLASVVALAVMQPKSRSVILAIVGTYVVSNIPTYTAMILLCFRHRLVHRIPWLITWWPFTMLRRAFVIESLFSLPAKPVRLPRRVIAPEPTPAVAPLSVSTAPQA